MSVGDVPESVVGPIVAAVQRPRATRWRFLLALAGLPVLGAGLVGCDSGATSTPTTVTIGAAGADGPTSAAPTTTGVAASAAAPTVAASPQTPPPTLAATTPDSTTPVSPATTADATVETGVPQVDAKAYVVFDGQSGKVLAEQASTERLPIASLNKLFVAQLVFHSGDLEQQITVPPLEVDPKESQIGLIAGEKLSRAILLRAMMIVSGNDAARALAIGIDGSETAFVERLNAMVAEMGLTDTVFRNASGLDAPGQHSTAADVLAMSRVLMGNEVFRQAVVRRTASLHGNTYPATNKLLGTYPGMDGIKTGHTTQAGHCIAASATRNGRQVVVVVLGSTTSEGRFAAAQRLLDWAFATTSAG